MSEAMSYGAASCLININWDAWVAIGTIALAVVTVWMSLRTDRNTDARIKDRELRDARVLAMAFQQEVHRVWAACRHLDDMRGRAIDKKFLLDMRSDKGRFVMGAMRDNLSSLGAFPHDVGMTVAKCYTASRSMSEMLEMPIEYFDTNFDAVSNGWALVAANSRPMFAQTYNALCRFTGEGKPIDTDR